MQISDEIIKVLDNLGQKFGVALDWTNSNVLPYVQDLGNRMVKYEIYTSILWLLLGVITSIISVKIICGAIKYFKEEKEENEDFDKEELYSMSGMISIILLIISSIIILVQCMDVIEALTIPESIWIKQINSLM